MSGGPRGALGVEIGGTKLQTAVVDPEGVVIARVGDRVDPAGGAEGIRSVLAGQIDRAVAEAGGRGVAIRAAGIGFGGPVDRASFEREPLWVICRDDDRAARNRARRLQRRRDLVRV